MTSPTNAPPLFTPLTGPDGYPPLEHLGLIGDGTTAALVDTGGRVVWLCAPRFDSEPLFCSILDAAGGGSFRIAPQDAVEGRQRYESESAVLVTEVRGARGSVRITDCLTLRAGADLNGDTAVGRGELLRRVEGLQGEVALEVAVDLRGGASATRRADGLRIRPRNHDLELALSADVALDGLETTIP